MSQTRFYEWNGYRCAYEVHSPQATAQPALLLVHPIGVGLSRRFWDRFCQEWSVQGYLQAIYNPDLLGCGESAMPRAAYTPDDWAAQLQRLIEQVIQRPVVLVVQGALFPIAIRLVQRLQGQDWVQGLVLSGPPGWQLISQETSPLPQKLLWNLLFDSPLGRAFYRYARREAFIESFSRRQLFAEAADVDREWLDTLQQGAADPASRYAVFAFLAGFWRKNYTQAIEQIQQPTLVVYGEAASGIDRVSRGTLAPQRLEAYLQHMPNAEGEIIVGRNVMPYESTAEFVQVTGRWLARLSQGELQTAGQSDNKP
ncbi:MAG: alpha/beta hydrolase [Cyanobacteria bacterium Co-bin13]|nr:alpha/beta hydrolase [Cyanobacteria bacterium Co-bin13]